MADTDFCDDLTGGIFTALRRNPVLYLDLETQEAVVLQQETIAALRAKNPAKRFQLSRENRKNLEEARRVLEEEPGRYHRMPGIRMPEIRKWIEEFTETFPDPKTRCFLRRAARRSRTSEDFTNALSRHPELLEEWLEFKAQKTMQGFLTWANSLPIFPFYGHCRVDFQGEEPCR